MNKKLATQNGIIILLATLIDQGSKSFVFERTTALWGIVTSWFTVSLQPSLNTYFAFSIPSPSWVILSIVLSVFSIVTVLWVREIKNAQTSSLWLALVLGGAIGNLADRFIHGGVIDWIELTLFGWSWSSFNFADMMILIGIIGWFMSTRITNQTKYE
jgi:signal peptidase II